MDGQVADISARAHCKYPNPKPTSDGKVEIDQDPDGIRFNQRTGELIKDVSSARHLAIEFDEDRHVEMLLEITAYSDHDKGGFFRYIQSETITITEWKPVCRFWRKPSLMTGTFRTALMTDAELAEARRHRPDWVPPCGTTVYKLLDK